MEEEIEISKIAKYIAFTNKRVIVSRKDIQKASKIYLNNLTKSKKIENNKETNKNFIIDVIADRNIKLYMRVGDILQVQHHNIWRLDSIKGDINTDRNLDLYLSGNINFMKNIFDTLPILFPFPRIYEKSDQIGLVNINEHKIIQKFICKSQGKVTLIFVGEIDPNEFPKIFTVDVTCSNFK